MVRRRRYLVRAPEGRRPNGLPHPCKFAGVEGCGCTDGAVAAGDDLIGGVDESEAGRCGQRYHWLAAIWRSAVHVMPSYAVLPRSAAISASPSARSRSGVREQSTCDWLLRSPVSGRQRRGWRPYLGGGRSWSRSGRPGRRRTYAPKFSGFDVPHRPVNTRPRGMLRQRRAGCSTLHERAVFRPLG